MFLKFAGCGAEVATEEKKVIHGHSCIISIHVFHQRGKSWTKEGVACTGLQALFLPLSCVFMLIMHVDSLNTAGSWLWPASMACQSSCQTAIFSWGRSSNKASENVSFEIYQVGSLDCKSSQKYTSILLPDKFRPVCNLLFKWYHYNRTVSVTSYLYLVIWLRGSTVHYSSALYALALPRTLAGHKLASNFSPSLLKCDNSLCMSWNMSSFYVHLILYGYLQIGKNNSTIPSYEKLRIK